MLFDQLDDYEAEREARTATQNAQARAIRIQRHRAARVHQQCNTAPSQPEADALSRAFGTRPPARLKPAAQDELFQPAPQARIQFPTGENE